MQFEQDPIEPFEPARELRRGYHDRIAEVREHSLELLRVSIAGIGMACHALLERASLGTPGAEVGSTWVSRTSDIQERAAQVDTEVVALLALESPVARDLRVILAARDVTQLGLLCLGLCDAVASRAARVAGLLDIGLRRRVDEVSRGTAALLGAAEGAWATLHADLAAAVVPQAVAVRAHQTEFLTALIAMEGVSMEAALDLAVVARAFERLADHAVEIAERVRFAVQGTPAPALEP